MAGTSRPDGWGITAPKPTKSRQRVREKTEVKREEGEAVCSARPPTAEALLRLGLRM